MSFRANKTQQLAFNDSFFGLTGREKKALERSWAKVFAEDIFPNINEEPFNVLYSDKASRPNTPVNVIIGALIIKELFGASDDEIVDNLMLDPRYQYALHTTSFEEQPLSDKSLSRFRMRCYEYERTHGVDLYRECIEGLSAHIAKLMNIDGRIRRMDSTMIEANIRRLSRIELIYTCIAKLVKHLDKAGIEFDRERLEHYLDPEDYNKVIYHSRNEDVDERMSVLLADADELIKLCDGQCEDATEYLLFSRCMSEQTIVDGGLRRLRNKEDGGMDSNMMQNPSAPDATYRKKGSNVHRGYVANIEESVGSNGSVVTSYQFEKNNVSDSAMLKEHLENINSSEEIQMTIAGAYASTENKELAAGKNIELVPTDLVGRDTDSIMANFKFNEDFTKVLECPAGHTPKSCSYNSRTEQCVLSFNRYLCANCPFHDQCNPKIYKRVAKKTVSRKSVARAEYLKTKDTDRFKLIVRLRNGVETVHSILKNQYDVDRMPVRGLQRCKLFFGSKIGALNFQKLFRFRNGTGNYAPNPILG